MERGSGEFLWFPSERLPGLSEYSAKILFSVSDEKRGGLDGGAAGAGGTPSPHHFP